MSKKPGIEKLEVAVQDIEQRSFCTGCDALFLDLRARMEAAEKQSKLSTELHRYSSDDRSSLTLRMKALEDVRREVEGDMSKVFLRIRELKAQLVNTPRDAAEPAAADLVGKWFLDQHGRPHAIKTLLDGACAKANDGLGWSESYVRANLLDGDDRNCSLEVGDEVQPPDGPDCRKRIVVHVHRDLCSVLATTGAGSDCFFYFSLGPGAHHSRADYRLTRRPPKGTT